MRLLILTMAFLFSCYGFAQENSVTIHFRETALKFIAELEASGVQSLQNIPLAEIKKVTQEVPLVHYPNIKIKTGSRNCAHWQPSVPRLNIRGHIYLNTDCADLTSEQISAVALHEVLGFGFNADRNYEISAEVFTRNLSFPDKNVVDLKKMKSSQKRAPFFNTSGGGSTGVGGGGDFDDFRFKVEGLKYLSSTEFSSIVGIPSDILRQAILHMKVASAPNINGIAEFRGPGLENGGEPVMYIHSDLYRREKTESLGVMAVLAARLFIIHGSEFLGLTDENQSALAIRQPFLAIPIDQFKVMSFENTLLTTTMTPEEKEQTFKVALQNAQQIQRSPTLLKFLEIQSAFITLRLY